MTAATQSPRISILAGGAPLAMDAARTVASVMVRAALGVPAVAEVTFAEPPAALAGELAVGGDIALSAAGARLFAGKIAAIEMEHGGNAGRILRCRAYDALEALRQKRRIRRFDETSADDLAAQLAAEAGLSATSDRAPSRLPSAVQRAESDLEFLTRIAGADGLYPIAEGATLRLAGLEGTGAEIELRLGRELEEATFSISAERSLASAETFGWDPLTHRALSGEASRSAEPGAANLIFADRLLQDAAQNRSRSEAAVARGAAFERIADGVAIGIADILPARVLRIAGVDDAFAGRYVVTSAIHRFDAGGYRTLFSTRPPILPVAERGPVVTLGKVVSVDDPEGAGRSKVALPGFAGAEAYWLQTVVPGAGRRKGLGILPEPDEDVLVVLPDGDLAHGFVLGGLYGTRTPPPGLRGRASRPFVLRTGAGQTLELSGKGSTARLSTRAGSLLEFAGDRGRLTVAGDLTIEAPGRRILIRAASVDFERG